MRSLIRFRGLLTLCIMSTAIVGGTARAALTVTATADVDTARPNELLNIELLVANSDAVARNNVTVTMVMPNDINFIFETEFDGDCPSTTCDVGETATWTLGTLAAGSAVALTVPASVLAAAADAAVITFNPTVTDDLALPDSDSTSVTVNSTSKYDLVLAESVEPAAAGSEISYKLTYGFLADAGAVANTVLSFALPAGATFVSASDGGTPNAGNVEWALGFMQPGDGGTREVAITLPGGLDAGDVVTTTAEIRNVANAAERIGAATATQIGSNPFGLAIESVIDTVRTSEIANLQFTVTNTDPFTRFDVTLSGRYPRSFGFVFESEFDGDCASTTCDAGETIVWTLGDIPAGGSVTVDLVPAVAASAQSGTVEPFFAAIADSGGGVARLTDALRIQPDTIYDLALTEKNDPVIADSELTYVISYGLRDDAVSVNNSQLVFPIPDGTTFVSATGGGSHSNGVVTWPLGFLQPGDSGIREVTVAVSALAAAGDLVETFAELQGITSPAERARSEAITVVSSASPLTISIEANPKPARTQELTNIRLTVGNTDPFTRFGVDLHYRYPQSLAFIFETQFDGNCASTTCDPGERGVFALGDIPAGGAVSVDIPAPVASGATDGEIINLFTAVEDDFGTSFRRTESLTVSSDTPYDLSLSEDSDPVTAGSELTYILNWSYRADAAAVVQSTLAMPLPDGVTFVSASDGGVLNAGVVEWALGFLQPGQNGVRSVTVAVDGGVAAGEVIEAHADLYANAAPDNRMRVAADTAVAASVPLSLYLDSNLSPVRPLDLNKQQFTVVNNDAFTRFGVVLTVRYPQEYAFVFETQFDGDCASTSCDPAERMTYTLGDIGAGGAVTVTLPNTVVSAAADGSLVNLYATAGDDQGAQTRRLETIRVQDDTVYELALAEDVDPVIDGGQVSYALTYGYRADAGAVADSALRFFVPDGASFVAASGGGVLNGTVVEWPLGVLSPGDGDLRTVTVQADVGPGARTVLEAAADIATAGTGAENTRSEADTVLKPSVPLSLSIAPNRNNAEANAPVELVLTVTNNDPFTHFGVELFLRYAQQLNFIFESVPGFDGDCASTSCDPGERVTWLLGDIGANSSTSVLLPTSVSASPIDGEIINFFAWAEDDQGVQTRDQQALLLGCLDSIDADCDGISNDVDNCTTMANFGQQDTDGDLIGNACDADIAPPVNDCAVNFLDLNAMKIAFFSMPGDAEWNPDADLNSDNIVNFIDLNGMKSVFFGQPGPSAAGCN